MYYCGMLSRNFCIDADELDRRAAPTPNEADLRGPGRDEWKHEAAEWKRLK
jgi:hypothetical protein